MQKLGVVFEYYVAESTIVRGRELISPVWPARLVSGYLHLNNAPTFTPIALLYNMQDYIASSLYEQYLNFDDLKP